MVSPRACPLQHVHAQRRTVSELQMYGRDRKNSRVTLETAAAARSENEIRFTRGIAYI